VEAHIARENVIGANIADGKGEGEEDYAAV